MISEQNASKYLVFDEIPGHVPSREKFWDENYLQHVLVHILYFSKIIITKILKIPLFYKRKMKNSLHFFDLL